MTMNITDTEFTEFFDAYIEAALWTSTDEEDTPLCYVCDDIHEESLKVLKAYATVFLTKAQQYIGAGQFGQAGHDFWLSQKWRGVGLWDDDREWSRDVGQRLTEISEQIGELHLFVRNDKVHVEIA